MITYAHKKDPDGQRFRQSELVELPDWAFDVRDERELIFKKYRRVQIVELAEWHPLADMTGVSISAADVDAGSPKIGDMIARNPNNHEDRWLVAAAYFKRNFRLCK